LKHSSSEPPRRDKSRRRASAPLDIMSDVKMPVSLGNSPKLPLRFHSPAHSTERRMEYFNLSKLSPFGPLAHKMAEAFLLAISSVRIGTARALHAGVRRQFGLVAKDYQPDWDASDWHRAVHAAADATRNDQTLKATTRHQYILNGNIFTRFLQRKRIIPRFVLPQGVENARLAEQPKKAVSEVMPALDAVSPDLHLQGAGEETIQAWKALSQLMDVSDPEVVHERLKLILGHIRTFAIKGIRAHQEAHQAALSQASRAEHERIVRFLKVNNGRSSRSLGSGRGSKSVFTDISSVLSLIEYEYGGFPPSQHEALAFMRLVYNRFSLKELQYRLFLTTETAVYYLIIILIDTAMNISSALELDVGSLYETEGSNNYKLTWYKKRKGEDPIEDYFEGSKTQTDDEIGVVEVIKFLKQLNARLRDFAIPSERDKLFLVGNLKGPNGSSGKYRVGILTEHLEGKAWHRLRQRDPLLSRFPITLDMIRSSVLLLECLETNYDLFAVNKKAHHSSVGTTIRYNQRAAVRTLNNSQVREVQDFIVASATASQPQIRSELG